MKTSGPKSSLPKVSRSWTSGPNGVVRVEWSDPIIAELADEYAGKVKVGKLDVDENRVTAGRFSVRSIPSILYFKDGELVDAVVGAYPKKYLEAKILEYV